MTKGASTFASMKVTVRAIILSGVIVMLMGTMPRNVFFLANPNQAMKPTAPGRMIASAFATDPARAVVSAYFRVTSRQISVSTPVNRHNHDNNNQQKASQ